VGSPSIAALLGAALLAGGCLGGGDKKTVTVRETVTQTVGTTTGGEVHRVVSLYLLRGGKVGPASHSVVADGAIGAAALRELFAGPTARDRRAGLATAIPSDTTLQSLSIEDGIATVQLSRDLGARAKAQVVYTLTQFSTVKRVSIGSSRPEGRAAYERQTPPVLVESPTPWEELPSPVTVSGTANTFEAVFNYELKDADGRILTKGFTTATSGSGTRGTYEFKVRYRASRPMEGRLIVFEVSQADGSRLDEVEIPLRLDQS
jgi:hypothetical protein